MYGKGGENTDSDPYRRKRNGGHQSSYAGSTNHHKPVKSARAMITQFASRTSLQGIPFIYYTKRTFYKLIWVLLTVAALAGCCYQLYSISKTYFDRKTSTSISLGYSSLAFPSITVCNINPIRQSQMRRASQEMQDYVEDLQWDSEYEHDSGGRRRRSLLKNMNQARRAQILSRTRRGIHDDFNDTYINVGDDYFEDDDEEYGGTQRSRSDEIRADLEGLMGDMNRTLREEIGHQFQMQVLECSFQATQCDWSFFTLYQSKTYGNCYTFNSAENLNKTKALRTRKSGSFYGLDLILFLEDNEYVSGLTAGSGFRMDIHPYKTFPHLAEQGVSLHPGTQTYVGMRMINITRKTPPYGKCDETLSKQFHQRYNKLYSIESCNQTCADIRIAERCKCYRPENYEYYTNNEINTLQECDNDASACINRIIRDTTTGQDSCDCTVPCHEQIYEMHVSENKWPNAGQWFELVDLVCSEEQQDESYVPWEDPQSQCTWLKNMTDSDDRRRVLQENFINLKVFYESLNYEDIKEKVDYEVAQYISDFGGTLGLWIGASVLTVMEVFDLLLRLFSRKVVLSCTQEGSSGHHSRGEDEARYQYSNSGSDKHGGYRVRGHYEAPMNSTGASRRY